MGEAVYSPTDRYVLHVVKTAGLVHMPDGAPQGGHSLVLNDLETGQSRVLASFPGVIYLDSSSISPEGDWIAIRTVVFPQSGPPEEPTKLWVVRYDGRGLREVVGQPAAYELGGQLRWAGDGIGFVVAWLHEARQRSALYRLDANVGEAQALPIDWTGRDLVDVSRDGRRLLVVRGAWMDAVVEVIDVPSLAGSAPPVAAEPTPSSPAIGTPTAQNDTGPRFGEVRDILERVDHPLAYEF